MLQGVSEAFDCQLSRREPALRVTRLLRDHRLRTPQERADELWQQRSPRHNAFRTQLGQHVRPQLADPGSTRYVVKGFYSRDENTAGSLLAAGNPSAGRVQRMRHTTTKKDRKRAYSVDVAEC